MMYRQNSNALRIPLAILFLLGIVFGVGFFLYDNVFNQQPPTGFVVPTQAVIADLPTQLAPTLNPILEAATPDPNAPTLFIPTAGVHASVITVFLSDGTWDVSGLGTRVGHLQRTPWLNEPGNIVLAGHVEMSNGRQGIFATLESLELGDSVILAEQGVQYRYAVKEVKYVAPDDLSVLYPTDKRTVTLITCSDYNFLSNTYDQRLIVVAEELV